MDRSVPRMKKGRGCSIPAPYRKTLCFPFSGRIFFFSENTTPPGGKPCPGGETSCFFKCYSGEEISPGGKPFFYNLGGGKSKQKKRLHAQTHRQCLLCIQWKTTRYHQTTRTSTPNMTAEMISNACNATKANTLVQVPNK